MLFKPARLFVGGAIIAALIVILYVAGSISKSSQSLTASSPGYMGGDVVADESAMALGADSFAMSKQTAARGLAPIMPPEPGYGTAGDPALMPAQRLIIKTAELSVVVSDVQKAAQDIVTYAEAQGGFEVTRNVYKDGLAFSGSVTVRIPVKAFESGLSEARKLGEVESQQINGQDVTEEYVDVATQLKNLRAAEEQFLSILRKANKIEDILAVQRELNQVRGQIERLEGRKQYLQLSADLATITVNLSTDPNKLPVVDDEAKWRPLAVSKDAARSLLELGKGVVNAIIWFAVYLPVWLLIVLVVWLIRRNYRRRQQKA